MTIAIDPGALDRFRSLVAAQFGLSFDDSKLEELADVLRERLRATGGPPVASYLERLGASRPEDDERRAVVERLTVGETYFYRNPAHFQAFVERVVQASAARANGRRRLRLLSAGCASGEEAYTLAILLHEHLPDLASWDVRIVGIDINPAVVDKARRGRYSSWSLRAASADAQARWFRRQGQEFHLDPRVRALVSFEERNLGAEDPGFWAPESFDVIFCRNVFIYFTPEAIRAAVARFSRALAPGGFLFLGDAETLRGVSHDFHLCHTHETFYYQRREAGDAPVVVEPLGLLARQVPTVPPLPDTAWHDDGSWLDAIQRASERIAVLADGSASPPTTSAPGPLTVAGSVRPTAALPGSALGQASDLFRQERFGEAMDVLRAIPSEAQVDPDVLILQASVLTNRGQSAEAREVCRQVLEADEFNAGAHYLLALCCEHTADFPAAREHDRIAVYLDPVFAMPHLHLGLLAKRSDDLEGARRELTRALELLAREDAARILLFGGGFNREALIQVCRAELKACGGRA